MEPDLDKATYKGEVSIDLKIKEGSFIELNTLDINFENVVVKQNEKDISPSKTTENKKDQTIRFDFETPLEPGTASLDIKFNSELNDKLAGFYRSEYKHDGKTKIVATTQMEATDCRRAFPCFDEPSLKATFDITLVSEKNLVALSNMDVKSETEEGDKKITVFNTTPIMSTYLVAFVVGDLVYLENNDFRIPVRVYVTPDLASLNNAQFSIDVAAKCLKFYEDVFKVPYPLPKMDFVGLHDFSAGAMENWGLVTYRLSFLLWDPKKDSLTAQNLVGEAVSHELAHQWFGNLVTMEWWDGLWLNEGFATYMSWLCCDTLFPEWKVWERYSTEVYQPCLSMDGLRASHPVQVDVARAEDVNQIFDEISYLKGSSVLTMISNFIGEKAFIAGVVEYLQEHKYKNTYTDDLWKALSKSSGKDVSEVMGVWTKQVGYPVVKVTEEGSKAHITQKRFLSTGDVKEEDDKTVFPIDLAIKTSKGVESKLIQERSTTIEIDPQFYKLNAESTGIYRVSYSSDRASKLSEAAVDGKLSVPDRVSLVGDARALAAAGYQKTSPLFDIVSKWSSETSPFVWEVIIQSLTAVRYTFKESRESIDKLIQKLLIPTADKLGHTISETEDSQTVKLKSSIFDAAVNSGDKKYEQIALDLFRKHVKGEKANSNLWDTVFSAASRIGTKEDYDALTQIYLDNSSNHEGNVALGCLGLRKDTEVLKTVTGYAFDGKVRSQDIMLLLAGFSKHYTGIDVAFQWMQDNWDEIVKKYPSGLNLLSYVVTACCTGIHSQEQYEQFKQFFSKVDNTGIEQSIGKADDQIRTRLSWNARDSEDVKKWLADHDC